MQITVELKDVYGKQLIYPACDKAKAFAAIAGTKTLSQANLWQIKDLGYQVLVAPRSL
jgi:hypothetical protein